MSRLLILAIAFGAASLFMRTVAPSEVALALVLPPGAAEVQGVDVRVTRPDGKQVLRARQPKGGDGRIVIVPTRLPRGMLRFEAWTYGPGEAQALVGEAEFGGGDALEVELRPRG